MGRYEIRIEVESDGDNLGNASEVETCLIDALEEFPGSVYIRGIKALAPHDRAGEASDA